jgi:hypothetical protein
MQDDKVVISGGFWSLPVSNVINPLPQVVAQALTNLDSASTKFNVDLGYQRNYVGLFFFANLRTSGLGLMRLRASLNSNMSSPTYDTGNVSSWPQDSVAGDFTPWGEWTLNGVYNSEEYLKLGMPRFFIPSVPVKCRYIRVEVFDQSASAPLQIGCFGACEVWESPIDFAPAPQITVLDESEITHVPFGSTFITQRGMRRRFNFGFPALGKSEILSKTLGLALLKGGSQPLVAVSFPDEGTSLEKTSVYGLVSQDGVISNPFFGHYAQPVQIDQLI